MIREPTGNKFEETMLQIRFQQKAVSLLTVSWSLCWRCQGNADEPSHSLPCLLAISLGLADALTRLRWVMGFVMGLQS